jgi:UDP-glucose 4-epimerase
MSARPSILVTGGAGYIGSHCCSALFDAGFDPICFDNLTTGHKDFVKWGPLIVGDIRQSDLVAETLRNYDVLAVMHFAAVSSVGESTVDPMKYYSNNVLGTLSLLQAMRQVNCNKLVFSSTGAVYGEAGREPIPERANCSPVNPYGQSKLTVERILADFDTAYGLRSICLRYFNACGAEPSGLIGERRDIETHLIPRLFMRLQGHVGEFAIFGEDYATPDGTAIRDYIHVVDLAEAHLLALEALMSGNKSGTFNLGTGKGCSVRDILLAVEKITGREVDVVKKPRRSGDPAILVADPSEAKRVLNFSARHSDIETIIGSAWTWHKRAHVLKDHDVRAVALVT